MSSSRGHSYCSSKSVIFKWLRLAIPRIVVQEMDPFNIFKHDNTKARSLCYGPGHRLALLLVPSPLHNQYTHLPTSVHADNFRSARDYLDQTLVNSFAVYVLQTHKASLILLYITALPLHQHQRNC